MQNEWFSTADADIATIISEESDGLTYVSKFISSLEQDVKYRTIGSVGIDSNSKDESHLERFFDDVSFEWGDVVNDKIIKYLSKNKVLTGRDSVIKKIFDEVPKNQLEKVAGLVALRDGGKDIIEKHKLFELEKIKFPITVHCPMCESSSDYLVSLDQVLNGSMIEDECPSCKHAPKDGCKCEFCSSTHIVFSIAKMVEERILRVVSELNSKIEQAADENFAIAYPVDPDSLLSRFLASRGGFSELATKVVEKALEVYKATSQFNFNTYQFAAGVVGDDGDPKVVARELVRGGFHYRKGVIPRKKDGVYPKVRLCSDNETERLYMLPEGGIALMKEEPEDAFDSTFFFNPDVVDSFTVDWDGDVRTFDEFSINHWALEHLSHGAVYRSKSNTKLLDGKVLNNKAVRERFMKDVTNGQHYIFPNIKIASLVDLDEVHKILNSSSMSLLENFEAALVAFNKDFEPEIVYIHSDHADINLFSRLIEPNLVSQGIKITYIKG
ncbi:hypothetical protein [Vibrio sp. D431a]|uniref:hypothetical protein n=1 Tax=Vibrio sp. D431a TaxID=2837388 RepID=UPI0025536AE1|nr:hypothetical protein [Vibrio sp. D431a]MDK9790633.1 hypothetical protein [Vibrio sp. D431a]